MNGINDMENVDQSNPVEAIAQSYADFAFAEVIGANFGDGETAHIEFTAEGAVNGRD